MQVSLNGFLSYSSVEKESRAEVEVLVEVGSPEELVEVLNDLTREHGGEEGRLSREQLLRGLDERGLPWREMAVVEFDFLDGSFVAKGGN